MPFRFTLAVCKPDAFVRPYVVKAMYEAIQNRSLQVFRYAEFQMSYEMANSFYQDHRGKFYYDRLVYNITSGPMRAHILYGDDPIKTWREIIGPTKVNKLHYKPDGSLRSDFGLSDTRNSFHGSDSEESAKKEIEIIFPNFEYRTNYKNLLPQLLASFNSMS